MKNIDISMLADRLLYGPDKPDSARPISQGPLEGEGPDSAASSPAVAHASPTELHAKDAFSSTQSAATSPTTAVPSPPVSPRQQNDAENYSVTSSPTIVESPSIDVQAKNPCTAEETALRNSTSTDTTSSSIDVTPAEQQVDANINASSPVLSPKRPTHPAVKAWKSIWSRPSTTWHPTALQIRPLVGVFGLCVAIACAFGSLTILLVSDGQATADWYVSPAVLLAIVTAVANSAIALAYIEAVPISFWYSMTRGRTVRSLERQWQVSRSIVYAIAKLRHLSVLNIACIAVAIVVIDGPLVQRASTVVRATQVKNVTLELQMIPEIPSDFTGVNVNHILQTQTFAVKLFPDYTTNEPMTLDVQGCNGKCRATIQGPGVLMTDCSQQVWPVTSEMLHSYNASWGTWKSIEPIYGTPSAVLPAFEVSVLPVFTLDSSAASMQVGYASWFDLIGNYTMKTCVLVPAIAEYDVEIANGVFSIPKSPKQGRVVHRANNTRGVEQSVEMESIPQDNAMDAVTVDAGLLTQSNVTNVLRGSPAGNSSTASEFTYTQYPLTYSLFAAQHLNNSNGPYDENWIDPTDDIVFMMNELMFRAGVMSMHDPDRTTENLLSKIDPGLQINQTVSAEQEITQNVYKSDLRWYAGAAIVQIATALITLPMFWGWWRLGSDLTLSPFSIALAFESPVLNDVNSAAGPKGVVERLGGLKLKYGAVESHEEKARGSGFNGRLGVAESQVVFRPHAGMTFER